MTHWAAQYIGQPWDPAQQHCWAFCRQVWQEHFGRNVPEMPIHADDLRVTMESFATNPERAHWQAVPDPVEGDAVLMAKGKRDCHVGIWVKQSDRPGGVLHAIKPAAVFTTHNRLRDIGYRITGYYRRVV